MKDVVQGEGVTGRQPILKPGEVFDYTSTAPLSVRPMGTMIIAARMQGDYQHITLKPGQDTATEEQVKAGGDTSTALGKIHFAFPEDQRVVPFRRNEDEVDEDDDDDDTESFVTAAKPARPAVPSKPTAKPVANPASPFPAMTT